MIYQRNCEEDLAGGPDNNLMIRESRASRGGSSPRGKLMTTEEAGAKVTAERAARGRAQMQSSGCTGAGAGRRHSCPKEDCYTSLVERAANNSDRVLI